MFAHPRAKKSAPTPPRKKRRATYSIEEISFDGKSRHDYLTGFRKRKLQRVKVAQEHAAKKAREERLEFRKQLRDDRRRAAEEHVSSVRALLNEAELAGGLDSAESSGLNLEEWGGIVDQAPDDVLDQEEEYIDEDKYTAVTVESVSVTKDGLEKVRADAPKGAENDANTPSNGEAPNGQGVVDNTAKPRPTRAKKFRYETKIERQITQQRQKAKKRARIKGKT